MTHLEIIKEAYDKCGIFYVIREGTTDVTYGSQYLFLCNQYTEKWFETENLNLLCQQKSFMEFENGQISSY